MTVYRTWPLEPPSIEHGWRLPISSGGDNSDRQHYMPLITERYMLMPAICGHLFNPGFATIADSVRKCFNCERRLGDWC